MNLDIKELDKQKVFDDFVKRSPNCNFMQSYNWSIYQESGLGRKTYRLGFYNGDELIATAYCYEVSQTFGKYIYCSRGPILKEISRIVYEDVLNKLREYFKDKEYLFLKIDPSIQSSNSVSEVPLSMEAFKNVLTMFNQRRLGF